MNGDVNTRLKVSPVCKRLGHSRQAFCKERVARRRKAVDEIFIVDAVVRAVSCPRG